MLSLTDKFICQWISLNKFKILWKGPSLFVGKKTFLILRIVPVKHKSIYSDHLFCGTALHKPSARTPVHPRHTPFAFQGSSCPYFQKAFLAREEFVIEDPPFLQLSLAEEGE